MTAASTLSVEIDGWPMRDGRVIRAGDLPRVAPDAVEEWAAFAYSLRGQFGIAARSGECAFAITDLTGSYPVFVAHSPGGTEFATSLDRVKAASRSISVEGLARFAAFGTAGPACALVEEARPLPGATVACARGGSVETKTWFDWPAALTQNLAPLEALEDEFRAIVESWVKMHLADGERVALLLSGGTDSALLGSLLKPLLGDRLECITQDFFSAAYSEKNAALQTAELLQLRATVARIGRRDYYRAFLDTNGKLQDTAIHGVQAHNLYCLARFARERGIDVIVTGEHADSLFLGFGHFFHGFPPALADYRQAIARATVEQKMDKLVGSTPAFSALSSELFAAVRIQAAEYSLHVKSYLAARSEIFEPLLDGVPLPRLQQLGGQIEGGVGWREICLPVMRALPGLRILCPFYDSDMIRFALRLPPELIFRDGQTKYFLRQLLKKMTGLECPKRPAALSPLRYWRVMPHARECAGVSAAMRPLYLKLLARNLSKAGALYNDMAKIAGLGTWMGSHRVAAR